LVKSRWAKGRRKGKVGGDGDNISRDVKATAYGQEARSRVSRVTRSGKEGPLTPRFVG